MLLEFSEECDAVEFIRRLIAAALCDLRIAVVSSSYRRSRDVLKQLARLPGGELAITREESTLRHGIVLVTATPIGLAQPGSAHATVFIDSSTIPEDVFLRLAREGVC